MQINKNNLFVKILLIIPAIVFMLIAVVFYLIYRFKAAMRKRWFVQ